MKTSNSNKLIKKLTFVMLLTASIANANTGDSSKVEYYRNMNNVSKKNLFSIEAHKLLAFTAVVHYEYLINERLSVHTSSSFGLLGINGTLGAKYYPIKNTGLISPYIGAEMFYAGSGYILTRNNFWDASFDEALDGKTKMNPGIVFALKNDFFLDVSYPVYITQGKFDSAVLPQFKIGLKL
ncbi:MAG: hypothetical protein J0M08_05880 [Bacteroidetes bacterium]|nr:hypothetical protein [Bacteroidota bacterium]